MESSKTPAPASSLTPPKLRLMCSTGGHIVPRPHDKSLVYIGGETRILAVDRHTTLLDLTRRLSKTLLRSPSNSPSPAPAFVLKYQLPSEDLDSLITVTTDEDLENMIDEYERLNSTSRLRLFIFPTIPDSGSGSLIGSFLENPNKSEDWFMNALNGISSGFSDSSSVNCLLDLDDEISLPDKSYKKTDVHSVHDSPMMETTSSFGSASSIPSPVVVSGSPVSSATAIQEQSDPFLLYHEKSDQRCHHHHQQQQQKQSTVSMDSILSNLTITDQVSVSQIQSSNHNNQASNPNDQNTIIQIQQQKTHKHPDYLSSIPTTQSNHQFHHHPIAVPVTPYYQHHRHHPPISQQNFMYYIPFQQPHSPRADTGPVSMGKTESQAGVYRATNEGGPQLVRVPSGYYATPLSTAQYQQMTSIPPVEANR